MSDGLDFDMEVVESDELDSLSARDESSTEKKSRSQSKNTDGREFEIPASESGVEEDTTESENDSDSGVQSVFDNLPENWVAQKLRDHVDLISGAHVKSDKVHNDPSGVPYLTGPEDFDGLGFEVTKYTDKPSKFCEKNDTLVTVKGSGCGKSALADSRACISRQLKSLRPAESLNPFFLYYYIKSKQDWLLSLSEGSAIPGLSNSHLTALNLARPPLPEQRKIASVLYAVDQAIQKTEAIIEQAQRVKRGLMQDFFHGAHMTYQSYKSTPVGEVPSHWEVTNIGSVVKMAQYGISESMSEDATYPIFRMNNIENGYIVDEPMKYIDLDRSDFEKYRVEKGDILFNRTNSLELVGKTGIFELEGDYVFASYLVRLRTNQKADPRYLNYYMNSHEGQNRMMDFATKGVSQANINANSIQQVKLPLPPKDEQEDIAGQLRSVDQEIEKNKGYRSQLKILKKGLMQDLLTSKVRTADKAIEVLDEVKAHG